MLANYHTHTWRCKHADPDERAYIEAAIAGGIRILGFADHTPYPGLEPPCHMRVEQAPEYFDTIRRLRDEYADRIEIHVGVEAEYCATYFPALLDLLRQNGCEYMLLGQHFLYSDPNGIYARASIEDGAVLTQYADEVIAGMETGYFTYVAHPDIVNYVGSDEKLYRAQMRRICQAAKALDIPLELNLLGLRKGYNYPNRRFWELAAEENCRALIGSDAHHVWIMDDRETENAGIAFLQEFGIMPDTTVPLVPIHG